MGNLASADNLDRLLTEARRQAVAQDESNELVFMDAELEMEGSEKIWAAVDNEDTVVENMTKVMKDSIRKTLHRSYTVKVNDTSVNLGSYGEVHELLEQALAPYDTANQYQVALELDADREVNVLEAVVLSHTDASKEEDALETAAGIEADFNHIFASIEPKVENVLKIMTLDLPILIMQTKLK